MRIAIVTRKVVKGDGQGRVNYELTRFLLRKGVEVHILADVVAADLIELGAKWIRIHPYSIEIDLVKVWHFKNLANKYLDRTAVHYDLILACGVSLDRPHNLNAVHFVHGTWLRSPYHSSRTRRGLKGIYQWIYTAANARWELSTLSKAEHIIAVSNMVREELVTLGLPREIISVIVNGVDIEEFYPGAGNRAALGLPSQGPLGLFVGDIRSPIKNLSGILRAMQEVPEMQLAVVGALNGSPFPALTARLQLSRRVYFLDFRRDIAHIMRAVDFFVLPSFRDSCPLVILEALASGLPVVTARTVGLSDLISDNCGFVIDQPDDHRALVKALQSLSSDKKLLTQMGYAARAVAESLSWELMAERYLSLMKGTEVSLPMNTVRIPH